MTEPIDHTELAASSVPFARRATVTDTGVRLEPDVYMKVYTAGLDLLEDEAQQLDRWINDWQKPSGETPLWVLDQVIGSLFGFPRPDGVTDIELYRRLLRLAKIARTAGGSREGIRDFFEELAAPYGQGPGTASVAFPGLNHVVVTLTDADPIALLPGVTELFVAVLGEVDSLDLTEIAGGIYFTFDVVGLGFDDGLLAP